MNNERQTEGANDHSTVLTLDPRIVDQMSRGWGIKARQETTVGRQCRSLGRRSQGMNGSGPGVVHQLTGVVVMTTNQPSSPTPIKFIHIQTRTPSLLLQPFVLYKVALFPTLLRSVSSLLIPSFIPLRKTYTEMIFLENVVTLLGRV